MSLPSCLMFATSCANSGGVMYLAFFSRSLRSRSLTLTIWLSIWSSKFSVPLIENVLYGKVVNCRLILQMICRALGQLEHAAVFHGHRLRSEEHTSELQSLRHLVC